MEAEASLAAFDWTYRLVKRAFPPGHPFFEEGDIYCNVLLKQTKIGEEIQEILVSADQFMCDALGCGEWFTSIFRYEAHYNSIHRNRCHACHRSFPSLHLLDIHILENHDAFFQMIAVKKHMYHCLVESCPDKFSSEKERKDHLVKLHKYPGDFRFNRKSRKQAKAESSAAKPEASSVAEQSKTECMDTSACSEDICPANQVPSMECGKPSPQKRPPRTICFGRGSTRAFQREVSRRGKGKKKSKEKATGKNTNEVSMDGIS